jgi:hypothetical protein
MDERARPCFACGYDLRSSPTGSVCPECGSPPRDERDVIDYHAIGLRRTRWRAGAVVVGGILFSILLFTALAYLAPS